MGEYVLFLGHARGSACEVQTHFVIAGALGYGSAKDREGAESLPTEVTKILNALMTKLKDRQARTR
jgi:four helix bundle protein